MRLRKSPTNGFRLAPRDAEFIYNESDGHPGHLIAVYFFETSTHAESEFSLDEACNWVTARLGCHRLFTEYIRLTPWGLEHPYWSPAPNFEIRDHVHVSTITEPGWAPLQKLLSTLTVSPMDLTRPPWEMYFYHGIEGIENLPGRLTAVALKVHHSTGDGLAVRRLGEDMFSTTSRPKESVVGPHVPPNWMFLSSLAGVIHRTVRFAKTLAVTHRSIAEINSAKEAGRWEEHLKERPANRFNGKVSGSAVLESITLSGSEVREIRAATPGTTVNDVLLTTVGGALMQYLTIHDERPAGSLVAMVPRSMRSIEDWNAANQLVTLCVDLHSEVDDPIERLSLVARSAQLEKARTSHHAVRAFGTRFDSAPAPLLRLFAFTRKQYHYDTGRPRYQHTTVSNVPLTVEGLTLNGAPGTAVLAIQPPVDGDGLRHYLVAAVDEGLTLNVIADAEKMTDLSVYLELLESNFQELRTASQIKQTNHAFHLEINPENAH